GFQGSGSSQLKGQDAREAKMEVDVPSIVSPPVPMKSTVVPEGATVPFSQQQRKRTIGAQSDIQQKKPAVENKSVTYRLITPRRVIRQQVQPVQEDVQVNVARNVAGGGAVLAGGAGGAGGLVGGLSAGGLVGGGGGAVLGGEGLVALDGGAGLGDGGYGSGGGLVALGGEEIDAGGLSGGVVLGGGGKSSIGYNGVPADYK
ncbi:PREDICTED: keratin, type II cytoskeletal 1-like, partial [Rhagoletis zephyria]|uniref:keratin, type II cytoskeletal 1-like n=1 Tax=Rhagoletis zephyria TaxID=28612 RepID=UPI00081150F4